MIAWCVSGWTAAAAVAGARSIIVVWVRWTVAVITARWWRRRRHHLTAGVWPWCSLRVRVMHHSVLTKTLLLRSSPGWDARLWLCNSVPLNASHYFTPPWSKLSTATRFTLLPASSLWHDLISWFLVFKYFVGGHSKCLLFGRSARPAWWRRWTWWLSDATPWSLVTKQHGCPPIHTSHWRWRQWFPSLCWASKLVCTFVTPTPNSLTKHE